MARLNVNGKIYEIDADPATPLLYVLHDQLELNSVRFGCGLGQCGSCMVIIDGRTAISCVTPVVAAEDREILTLEGLGTLQEPGPLQRAFIEEQAAQCGYCIPGFIMSAHALLQRNPSPSDQELRQALDRNLCRCGTHVRILQAVRRAADEMQVRQAEVRP